MQVVCELVDHPDAVVCHVIPGRDNVIVQLETHPSDVPIVIGREGHVITSLRSLLSARAGRARIRVVLEYATERDRDEARGNRGRFDDR